MGFVFQKLCKECGEYRCSLRVGVADVFETFNRNRELIFIEKIEIVKMLSGIGAYLVHSIGQSEVIFVFIYIEGVGSRNRDDG